MNRKFQYTGAGLSFPGMLTILFIGLKLTNYITWSWFWVLSPMWIPLSLFLIIFLGFFGFIFIIDKLNDLRR